MPADLERIVELLIAYRVTTSVRRYSTPWRVRLLLTSRVWDPPRDARVWEDAAGHIVGFAMLWRRQPQAPYLILDRFVHPALGSDDLADATLAWGDRRAGQIAAEQGKPLTFYVSALDPIVCPGDHPASYGMMPMTPDPQNHNVYYARSLQAPLPAPVLPDGFVIRPLDGVGELEAYHDLYDFAVVNPQHRQELLASDEYAHLVVADQAGALVAYAECSICRAEWQRSGQRIGWVDYVGTRPAQQGQGLGRGILLACLHRLQAWGADTAMLVTTSANAPANRVYQATGFECVQVPDLPVYEKQIPL